MNQERALVINAPEPVAQPLPDRLAMKAIEFHNLVHPVAEVPPDQARVVSVPLGTPCSFCPASGRANLESHKQS